VYDLDLLAPAPPEAGRRWTAVVLSQLVTSGQGLDNPGGYRAVIRERSSGRIVGEFAEQLGADATDAFRVVLADFATMTAEEFTAVWLHQWESRSATSSQPVGPPQARRDRRSRGWAKWLLFMGGLDRRRAGRQ
jgi:hypothetical protein